MPAVRCPYCDAPVAEQPTPAGAPLPRFRDVWADQDGVVLGYRSAVHRCCGLVAAARVYAHALAETLS